MAAVEEANVHAPASVTTMLSVQNITEQMRTMNRADLLRMLNLQFDMPVVQDMDNLHPVTVYARTTLRVGRWNVPWLEEGAAGECCTGASLVRLGHKTATVKCYSTVLTKQSTVCARCEQLWALAGDDGFYEVTEDMKDAWARYQKGERKNLWVDEN